MLQITEPGQDKKRKVIGIDLGTTYSLVATVEGEQVHIIADEEGNKSLPSAVQYLETGEKVVGYPAVKALENGAKNVFYSMKRLMGKGLNDAQTQAFAKHVPFQLQGTEEVVYATAPNVQKSAVEFSADILTALKNRAEEYLGTNVYDAVITVPAYFNEAQRTATKSAAKLAGLNVLRLISEPTAAALAYGLEKKAQGLFLVYDLGGGTFDVSLLKLTDGVFRVIATGGDTYLGGDDIDQSIAEALNIPTHEARLKKEQISQGLPCAGLTEERLEQLATPLLQRTLDICENVLEDAEVDVENLTGVVLVGGSTRMPLVQKMVANYFDIEPQTGLNPDQVVAQGAALQAQALAGGKRDDMLLLDVTPLSLGLETMGNLVEKIIHRNTPIPITRAQKFTTFKDNQTAMDIHILQGERETVEGCRSLAKFRLKGIPPLPAGAARIVVTFMLDADGLLTVKAMEEGTGVAQSVDVSPSYGLAPEQILDMLKSSIVNAKSDVETRQLYEARLELERVLDACTSALNIDGHILPQREKGILEAALKMAKPYLQNEDRESVEEAMETLEKTFQKFSEERVNKALKQAIVGQNINKENV